MKEAQYNIKIIYPDHENVDDHFDPAGQLQAVNTNLGNFVPNANPTIVKNILYNDLGERTSIEYGNGTITNYKYDARRRMDQLKHSFTGFQAERNYKYDALSNILGITTANATSPALGQLGGPVNHEYEYDTYNRLIYATGNYVGPDDAAPNMLKQAYSLDMEYDDAHNILEKHQVHRFGSVATLGENLPQNAAHAPLTSYKLEYGDYATGQHTAASQSYVQPHAPRTIIEYPNENFNGDPEDPRIRHKMIDYDANGNQLEIRERITDPAEPQGFREVPFRKHFWDEEDRLRAVDLSPENDEDKPLVAVYTYDASGERSIKYVPGRLDARYSAKEIGKSDRLESMLYPNPLLSAKTLPIPEMRRDVKDPKLISYTKHYYIGSERITSVIGSKRGLGAYPDQSETTVPLNIVEDIVDTAGTAVQGAVAHFGKTIILPQPYRFSDGTYNGSDIQDPENYAAFWYHPDHLGSSSYITNLGGEITQHMEYLPFGETLIEEHLNSNNSPYKFNAKEMDAETGNYYMSARYYDPKWSIWLSVDPLAELLPAWSSYAYTFNNPVRFTDPTGMIPEDPSTDVTKNEDGSYTVVGAYDDGDKNIYLVGADGKRTGETIGTTLQPTDFMGTDDETGGFSGHVGTTFSLDNLTVTGSVKPNYHTTSTIYNADAQKLLDWGQELFGNELKRQSPTTFYGQLEILRDMSQNDGPLDFKASLGYAQYTAIRAGNTSDGKPIITTLRAIGNITFGANMRNTKPFTFGATWYYKQVMKQVGAYNQNQNNGNGYNAGFPNYGEHIYSGSYIYYGYFGKFE